MSIFMVFFRKKIKSRRLLINQIAFQFYIKPMKGAV